MYIPNNFKYPSKTAVCIRSVTVHIYAETYKKKITECNGKPRQATANPVGVKACSSTKGCLLRYIPTKSRVRILHISKGGYTVTLLPPPRRLVPSLGRKAIPVWQLSLSHRCHQMQRAAEASNSKPLRWKSMLIHQEWITALYTQHLLDSQSLEFEICIFPREAIPSHE